MLKWINYLVQLQMENLPGPPTRKGWGNMGRKRKGPSLFLISSYLIFDDTIAISLVGMLNLKLDMYWKIAYRVIEIGDMIIKDATSTISSKQR